MRRESCCLLALLVTPLLVSAATPKPAGKSSSDWATVAAWPNFMGGIWGSGPGAGGPDEARGLPKPKVKAEILKAAMNSARRALYLSGSSSCQPHGIPVDVGGEFFFSKGIIFLQADLDYSINRRIYMDGREHGDPDPSYYGHSIGHWEGATLVVDTVGFLPEVVVTEGVPGRGASHVEERFRLLSADKMELTIKVTNPEVLEEPWVTTRVMTRHPEWQLYEAYCNQNNRQDPIGGQPNLDLTPPGAR